MREIEKGIGMNLVNSTRKEREIIIRLIISLGYPRTGGFSLGYPSHAFLWNGREWCLTSFEIEKPLNYYEMLDYLNVGDEQSNIINSNNIHYEVY